MQSTGAVLAALALGAVLCGAQVQVVRLVRQQDPDGRTFFTVAGRNNPRVLKSVNGSEGHFDDALRNMMVPRVVGTPSHQKVKQYIIGEMRRLGWYVETDPFTAKTPNLGVLRFENIIAKLNPSASQTLVLACHYDSKYYPNMEFLGATDSAVPCAMLINLAHSLQRDLSALKNADLSLELWFFDGEEAFQRWSPSDSIYGARHLASKMERENTLGKIKLLVLLDLLGTPGPYFFNYYPASESAYRTLAAGERTLESLQHLKAVGTRTGLNGRRTPYFHERSAPHYVEDDHTPFLQKGVPILHMIPHEFPEVWHTQNDNWDAIDRPTVDDLNKILRMFVLNYFKL